MKIVPPIYFFHRRKLIKYRCWWIHFLLIVNKITMILLLLRLLWWLTFSSVGYIPGQASSPSWIAIWFAFVVLSISFFHCCFILKCCSCFAFAFYIISLLRLISLRYHLFPCVNIYANHVNYGLGVFNDEELSCKP